MFYRFADWIFERINEVRRNDLQRQHLFNAFRQSIQNEHKTLSLADQIPRLSEQLKKSLESVDSAALMTVITDIIIDLSRIYPQIFQAIFVVSHRGQNEFLFSIVYSKDIVDILIGWYIEPLPTDRILEHTAQALQKLRPFWIAQMEVTTLTLLEHFIEDADSYAQVNR